MMKNFPLPSFLKIRLLALIVGFLLVCFLLGAAKHLFAAYPGDCVQTTTTCQTWGVLNCGTACAAAQYPRPVFPPVPNAQGILGWTYDGVVPLGLSPTPSSTCIVIHYYFEYGTWHQVDTVNIALWSFSPESPNHGLSSALTDTCPTEDCVDERAALATQCGGDQYIINWDDQFCTGSCQSPCPEAGTTAGTMTSEGMFVKGPWCEDGCELVAASSNPGLEMSYKENGLWYSLSSVEFSGNTCTPGVDGAPPIEPVEPPSDCATFLAQCEMACRGADQTQSWCDASGRNCSCDLAPPYPIIDPDDGGGPRPDQDEDGDPSDTDPDVDGDGTDNGPDPDVDGDGTDNGDDSDVDGDGTGNGGDDSDWDPEPGSPGGTGSDGDVDGDGESNCDDDDVDGDGLPNGTDGDADGDGVPNGSDLNPTGCDGTCVDDPSTPEDECGSNGTGECVDDPNTTQDECEEYGVIGTGSPGEPYSPGEFNIGDRFNTFITRIRQTGVFALPNDFFNAPPSGGSPVFSFEFGSYGTRTVDLSDMSQPLLILRTIVLIAFGFVCLRVVILKR